MTRPTTTRLVFAAALALALSARAQSFELDLSESTEKAPPAYRPILAILGSVSTEPPSDVVTATRAKELEFELVRLAKVNDTFSNVIDPAQVAMKLGAQKDEALRCVEWGCMEKLAKQLGAHRLLIAQVSKAGIGSLVTLKAYDPSQGELLSGSQDSGEKAERTFAGVGGKTQAQKDKEYLKHVAGFLVTTLGKLTTPNGKIIVDNPEPNAVVNLDGVDMGSGHQEFTLPRGAHTVKVNGDAYLPFEQLVTVEPAKDAVIKVILVAKPIERKVEEAKPAAALPAFVTKPGLYVAVVGVAALVAGVAMGAQAKGIEARAVPDATTSIVPITRAEAKDAQSKAVLANVLGGLGVAAIAGGGAWLWVSLGGSGGGKGKTTGGSTEPGEVNGMVGVGGTF